MSSIENFNLLERFASMRFCGNIVWSLNVTKFKAELRIALMSSGEVAQKSFNPSYLFIGEADAMNQACFNLSKAPFHWPLNRAYNAKGFAFRVPLAAF